MPHRILGVIPARYASSRFPGKPLVDIAGKTMLEHVWERASQARYLTDLVIATDDDRIRNAAAQFRAKIRMTRPDHPSGTDRVAEVAASSDAQWVVNIQGDEPMIDPAAIDAAILGVLDHDAPMGTLKKRIARDHEITDPNVVKVVTDREDNAIYFSRSPIPYFRDARAFEKRDGPLSPRAGVASESESSNRGQSGLSPFSSSDRTYFKHIGLYIYKRDLLLAYPDFPVGPLERAERLEQLRALENGFKIRVVETDYESLGVDTPDDWKLVAELYEKIMITG